MSKELSLLASFAALCGLLFAAFIFAHVVLRKYENDRVVEIVEFSCDTPLGIIEEYKRIHPDVSVGRFPC